MTITGAQLATETGLTYRQVDYWTTRGVLAPATPNPGSGVFRHFAEDEARVARALRQLRELGAGLDVLAEAGQALRALHEHEWHGCAIVNTLGMIHRYGPAQGWAIDLDLAANR